MPEKDLNKEIYKKYGSPMVRKAQRAISEQGEIPTVENVSEWIQKEIEASKRQKKNRLQTHGVPQ